MPVLGWTTPSNGQFHPTMRSMQVRICRSCYFFRMHLPDNRTQPIDAGPRHWSHRRLMPPTKRILYDGFIMRVPATPPKKRMRSASYCFELSASASIPIEWFLKSRLGRSKLRPFSSRRVQSAACAISYPPISWKISIPSISLCSANLHPKYAMSVFKKSTGMTLNNYVTLLRLSYAQAMLLRQEVNVLAGGYGERVRFVERFQQVLSQYCRHVSVGLPPRCEVPNIATSA